MRATRPARHFPALRPANGPGSCYGGGMLRGFLAVTNPSWYECLSQLEGPLDANFWRPSTRRVGLDVGAPFLFKLKAPHHAIAGFGYFAGFSVLPDWLAWDTFGRANGVGGLDELRGRVGAIQRGARIDAAPGGLIGCGLIAEARFFPPEAWVKPPADWKVRSQTGMGYDLSQGEGRRVWQECLARAAAAEQPAVPQPAARYGPATLHTPRLGQGIFRVQVLDAYGRACTVTGEHSLPVLEAAHIVPYASGGENRLDNGLALRADLHRLFDRGYVTVDEDLRFVVGRRLRDDFENGRSYYGMNGKPLVLPADVLARPDLSSLAWHRDAVFLG